MDDKFMDICQRGIDGQASTTELSALEEFLRGNQAAQLECEQLEAAAALLSEVRTAQPPSDMKSAVMAEIERLDPQECLDTRTASRNGVGAAPEHPNSFAEWLRTFMPRDAFTFASGLAAGAFLFFALSPALIQPDPQTSLSGAIGVLAEGAEIHNELVALDAGTLSSHLNGQRFLADLVTNSGDSTEWTIEFDPGLLRVEEILRSAGDEGLLDQSRGRIFIREPGESRYSVLFHVREGVVDPQLTLNVRSGSLSFDGVLHGRPTQP
jgi:hypothetical protein